MNSTRRIHIFFNGRFPGERAASLFAAKNAATFVEKGWDTVLIVPNRYEGGDPYEYYRVPRNFSIERVNVPNLFSSWIPKSIAFYIATLFFTLHSVRYIHRVTQRGDIILSNEGIFLLCASFVAKRNYVYELHDFPEKKKFLYRILFRRIASIISTNVWKADMLQAQFGVDKHRIIIEPNAVETSAFSIPESKEDARNKLGLSLDAYIVLYTGHLYSWKGVDTFALAAQKYTEAIFYVVGGTEEEKRDFDTQYAHIPNLVSVKHRPHSEIPFWQKAADIVVLPNTAREKISAYYTSPMKLFEYLASGTPLVASDLPSIRSVADDSMVTFFQADNAESLVDMLKFARGNSVLAKEKAARGQEHMLHFSWEKRAERIIRAFATIRS